MPDPVFMPIELIYESLYSALSLSDSSFQIWMSFTFAVIVAAHLAGDRINRTTYSLACWLYGIYSGVLLLRYLSAAYQIIHYQNLLLERGFEPWPVPKPIGIAIGSGTFLLMAGGTLATLWFVRTIRRAYAAAPG